MQHSTPILLISLQYGDKQEFPENVQLSFRKKALRITSFAIFNSHSTSYFHNTLKFLYFKISIF